MLFDVLSLCFLSYFRVTWLEVEDDMQVYILERLFCKQYRERKDTQGRQIIVILKYVTFVLSLSKNWYKNLIRQEMVMVIVIIFTIINN